ncbi:MAG: purine-binding chemotaxis protein CheW [Oleiphilaceae bacterium]|jgi:purine-binding chemotaxis protein CheW
MMQSNLQADISNKQTAHSINGKVQQFLTFELSAEMYGINILDIKEIVDCGHITPVPMMSDFIAGVINLRGSVVPIVDLASRFSAIPAKRSKRSSIVILEHFHDSQKLEIGIIVDVVNEVQDIFTAEIEQPPSFGTKIRTDFISGMGKVKDQLLVLLEIKTILSIPELSVVECL